MKPSDIGRVGSAVPSMVTVIPVGVRLMLNGGGGAAAGVEQKRILKTSELAPESELSSRYTTTDWSPLGHVAPTAVQSPTSEASPPVPLEVWGFVITASMISTGTLMCRAVVSRCRS